MPKSEQGIEGKRYQVIPRSLIFVTRQDEILLLKGAQKTRLWANRYNGVGGHMERGEDALSAARRELLEETGLTCDPLWLAGTVMVDVTEYVGVCIFVFRGEFSGGRLKESDEGTLRWCSEKDMEALPILDDLQTLLPAALSIKIGDPPFFARSFYDENDQLQVKLTEGINSRQDCIRKRSTE